MRTLGNGNKTVIFPTAGISPEVTHPHSCFFAELQRKSRDENARFGVIP